MTAHEKIQEERKKLTEIMIEGLEKEGISYIKRWTDQYSPQNASTNKNYKAGNSLKLMAIGEKNKYEDPRWVTYKQAEKEGWQVKKNSKGVLLEKWIFEKEEKYKTENGEIGKRIIKLNKPIPNYFIVFNGKDIEGIPDFIEPEKLKLGKYREVIDILEKSSECPIHKVNGNRAYYSITNDEIVLPTTFKSEEEYIATLTHEMAHSTGHSKRLNRNFSPEKEEYAKEELRAEISALFIAKELGVKLSESHIENHQFYVKSWIKILRDDPGEIYKASADAERITDRIKNNYFLEYEKNQNISKEMIEKKEISENLLFEGLEIIVRKNNIFKELDTLEAYKFLEKIVDYDKDLTELNKSAKNIFKQNLNGEIYELIGYEKTIIKINYMDYDKEMRIDFGQGEFGEKENPILGLEYRLSSWVNELIKNQEYHRKNMDFNEEDFKLRLVYESQGIKDIIKYLKKEEKEVLELGYQGEIIKIYDNTGKINKKNVYSEKKLVREISYYKNGNIKEYKEALSDEFQRKVYKLDKEGNLRKFIVFNPGEKKGISKSYDEKGKFIKESKENYNNSLLNRIKKTRENEEGKER